MKHWYTEKMKGYIKHIGQFLTPVDSKECFQLSGLSWNWTKRKSHKGYSIIISHPRSLAIKEFYLTFKSVDHFCELYFLQALQRRIKFSKGVFWLQIAFTRSTRKCLYTCNHYSQYFLDQLLKTCTQIINTSHYL